MREPIPLTGKTYGHLTVLRPDPDKPRYWVCSCSCGNVASVRRDNLTTGRVVSCGHARNRGFQPADSPLTGRVFGHLTVLDRSPISRSLLVCLCQCGATKAVRRDNLLRGNVKSCGCQHHRARNAAPRTPERILWRELQHILRNPNDARHERAVAAGIVMDPAWHDYDTFLRDVGPAPAAGAVLVRRDPAAGYAPGNVVWKLPPERPQET